MENSKIKDHKFVNKQLITPWNYLMGEKLELRSWYKEKSPEYLWIAGILDKYGRKKGLAICYQIIEYIIDNKIELDSIAFSCILKANNVTLYDYIAELVGKEIFDSLCVICMDNNLFREKFYIMRTTNENRIHEIQRIMKLITDGHSYMTTDIRFLIVWYYSVIGKLKFVEGMNVVDAIKEYYHLDHEDEKMRLYRSSIRSLEINSTLMYKDEKYLNFFWSMVGSLSECQLSYINYKEVNKMDITTYISVLKREITLLVSNHDNEYSNMKFSVITSNYVYCLKLLNEIENNNLYLSISARIIFRTIIECYVNVKYMLRLEKENANIWSDFMEDGLGKYKLINMKYREYNKDDIMHVTFPVLDALTNEIKEEEFLDVNLGFFKNKKIKDRFEDVGEKELYDLMYDYDVQFSHGHWGAIRESATTICSNPLHEGHFLADINFDTNCSSIKGDIVKVMNKFSSLIKENYDEFNIEELKEYGL